MCTYIFIYTDLFITPINVAVLRAGTARYTQKRRPGSVGSAEVDV